MFKTADIICGFISVEITKIFRQKCMIQNGQINTPNQYILPLENHPLMSRNKIHDSDFGFVFSDSNLLNKCVAKPAKVYEKS